MVGARQRQDPPESSFRGRRIEALGRIDVLEKGGLIGEDDAPEGLELVQITVRSCVVDGVFGVAEAAQPMFPGRFGYEITPAC
jgi:hypothetical protein